MSLKDKRFVPTGLAASYMTLGPPGRRYRAVHRRKGHPRGGWMFLYYGNRKVFDCNCIFFQLWLREAR